MKECKQIKSYWCPSNIRCCTSSFWNSAFSRAASWECFQQDSAKCCNEENIYIYNFPLILYTVTIHLQPFHFSTCYSSILKYVQALENSKISSTKCWIVTWINHTRSSESSGGRSGKANTSGEITVSCISEKNWPVPLRTGTATVECWLSECLCES